jgi:HD-GYP domain-containing protein (c-di-GMP phosphodiesterase class II)
VELARKIESDYAQTPSPDAKPNESGLFYTLFSLVVAVDKTDCYTKIHSEHIAEWAPAFAEELKLPADIVHALEIAGLLHDVGKIGVPDIILKKPGPLSSEEYDIMKGHVILSERLIQELPLQSAVMDAVSCHHERWDGTGYPRRRAGDQMPLVGRIMGLVDAYSAMCLDRPYRVGMTHEEIFRQLREGAGQQFDPDLVESFIAFVTKRLQIADSTIAPRKAA